MLFQPAENGHVRSSLERMLDDIRLRDSQPAVDTPPPLPSRPTSRGRLPSSRRPLLPLHPIYKCSDSTSENLPTTTILSNAVLNKVPGGEDARSLRGVLWFQKRFRGRRARGDYQEMRRGAAALQSFVRGERARSGFGCMVKRWEAAVVVQKYVKGWIARRTFSDQREDVTVLQAGVRGLLARRKLVGLQNVKLRKKSEMEVHKDQGEILQEIKDVEKEQSLVKSSAFAELQLRVLQVETALKHKEDENSMLREQLQRYETRWSDYEAIIESMATPKYREDESTMLREQLRQYETRWSKYEAKMKSMEENWQKQLTSLQGSLVAAKQRLKSNDSPAEPVAFDASSDHLYFDSDSSLSTEITPDGTPAKQPRARSAQARKPYGTPANLPQHHSSDAKLSRNSNGRRCGIRHLVEEFEEQSRALEEKVAYLVEVNSGRAGSLANTNEEYRSLKVRFDAWRKEYKLRLKETKAGLQKVVNSEPKARKRWWTTSCTR